MLRNFLCLAIAGVALCIIPAPARERIEHLDAETRTDVPKYTYAVLRLPSLERLATGSTDINVTVAFQQIGESEYFSAGSKFFKVGSDWKMNAVNSCDVPTEVPAQKTPDKYGFRIEPHGSHYFLERMQPRIGEVEQRFVKLGSLKQASFVGCLYNSDARRVLVFAPHGLASPLIDADSGRIVSRFFFSEEQHGSDGTRMLGSVNGAYLAVLDGKFTDITHGKVLGKAPFFWRIAHKFGHDGHTLIFSTTTSQTATGISMSMTKLVSYDLINQHQINAVILDNAKDNQIPSITNFCFLPDGNLLCIVGTGATYMDHVHHHE